MSSEVVYVVACVVGLVLVLWASLVNPWADCSPDHGVPKGDRVHSGPYRVMKHPIYFGEWLLITGFAGLASGWWGVLSLGILSNLLLRDWITREERS